LGLSSLSCLPCFAMPREHIGIFDHSSSHDCAYRKLYDQGYFHARNHNSLGQFPAENILGKSHPYPEAGIYEITNGHCASEKDEIYLSSGRLMRKLQADKGGFLRSFKRLAPQPSLYINGTLLHISLNGLESNFYHFNVEYLARLYLYLRSGLKADYFILPNSLPFQKELLKILGLDSERILTLNRGQLLTAKKILAPTFINNYTSYLAYGFRRYDKIWLPYWLADAYRLVTDSLPPSQDAPFIYISRDKATYRKVINEEEVIAFLAKQGFKTVYLEEMPLSAQIRLFMGAKRIVAPHGAGLVNMSWCREPAHILEIFPLRYSDPSFRLHADLFGHHYSFMRSHYYDEPDIDPQRMNLLIDIDFLREWLTACDNHCKT